MTSRTGRQLAASRAGRPAARTAPRARRAVGVVLALAMAAGTAACTDEAEPTPQVVVTGELGGQPELQFEAPLAVTEPSVEVVAEGTGPTLSDGDPVLLNFYAVSAADASLINETYSSEPRAYELSEESIGVEIYRALLGQHVGSRILHVVPASEGQAAGTVAVFDILPTRADGEILDPREGLPTVERGDDGTPVVTIPPETPPPADLVVVPLIRGIGPQVSAGQVITVQYVGVTWSNGSVFESSWDAGELPVSFPIGVQSVLEGWDVGLIEQPVGSQVMLVVPPSMAYGGTPNELAEETLVYVVDILSAVGGPEVTS